jgi:ubiquinone/menaquinone biosynthesis C-methylase UbiE
MPGRNSSHLLKKQPDHKNKPMNEYDYQKSHLVPGKGKSYDVAVRTGRYRTLVWAWEQQMLQHILSRYYPDGQVCLLDFACGTGRIIGFMEDKVDSATGVDVSESMLSVTAGKLQRSELLLADLTEENVLGDRKFNLITAFRFFLNAQPALRRKVITVLADLLTEDGHLVFNNHLQHGSLMHLALSFSARLRGRSMCRTLSMAQIRSLLSEANLQIADVFHWGLLPANDKRLPLPGKVLAGVEGWISRWGLFRPLAQNVLLVCAKSRNP